ncbi:hypothetical protein TWF751_002375 [Orbilia oligospora]|nr:hypothetical protein TWF751_002375 [Orbilia oligospora]
MWQMQMDLAHVNSHAVIAEHKSLWVRQSSRIQSKYFTSIVGFRPRIDKALENIRYPRICARSALLVWQHYNNNNQLQINFNRNYLVWMAREVSSAVIVGTYTTMYL